MEDWISNVILKWKSEGVKLNPPATIADIEEAEAVLNFKFPLDFKEFYFQADGFKDFDMQEHLFTLWPLEEIIRTFKYSETNLVGFADYLANSSSIGFSKNWPGIFKDYEHINLRAISETFEELLGMINSDPGSAY